jgi:hypothetical protein
MTDSELYVSIDVETDGPIPGEYSMLSLGSATFESSGQILDKFEINIRELPEAKKDAATTEWWATEPEAWQYCRQNPVEPTSAMHAYLDHLLNIEKTYQKHLVCIGYPVTFDFMFVYWYLIKFTGKSPFSFSGLDIGTMAMTIMRSSYKTAEMEYMPRHWFAEDIKHNHTPLCDAIEQGHVFCSMLKEIYK